MKSSDRITENIETLRERLLNLIKTKEDLLDPEIVKASTLLDRALDEYYCFITDRYRG